MPSPNGSTAVYGFPYLLETDPPDVATASEDLATSIEAVISTYIQGTASARPTAGKAGRWYYATDTKAFSYDNGSAWEGVASNALPIYGSGAALWGSPLPVGLSGLLIPGVFTVLFTGGLGTVDLPAEYFNGLAYASAIALDGPTNKEICTVDTAGGTFVTFGMSVGGSPAGSPTPTNFDLTCLFIGW